MTPQGWYVGSIVQKGVVIRGEMRPGYEKVLTPEALDFAVELEREFGAERRRLLARRAELYG
jgi:malate synthase